MATKPTNTAILYALTSSGACSITLSQDDKIHTWQALPESGGQTTFIIPAGAVAELSDESALLSPLPFKTAPGAGSGIGGALPADMQKLLDGTATESNAALSSLSWAGLCAAADTEWLKETLLGCVSGDTAYIDLSGCNAVAGATPAYTTTDTPLLAGDGGRMRLGGGVDGLKRMVVKMNRFWYNQDRLRLDNDDVDFVLISNAFSIGDFRTMESSASYYHAKSLTIVYPIVTDGSSIGLVSAYATSWDASKLAFPIRYILPCVTNNASFRLGFYYSGAWHYDERVMQLDITACMPSYVSSFSFYASNLNSAANLVYLMDNLGTPAAGSMPQLTFGIAAAEVDMNGDEPVYADAALQAAADRLSARGWEVVPTPITA